MMYVLVVTKPPRASGRGLRVVAHEHLCAPTAIERPHVAVTPAVPHRPRQTLAPGPQTGEPVLARLRQLVAPAHEVGHRALGTALATHQLAGGAVGERGAVRQQPQRA